MFLAGTLLSKYEYTDHSATAAQFYTHTKPYMMQEFKQSAYSKKTWLYELSAAHFCPHMGYFCCQVPNGLSSLSLTSDVLSFTHLGLYVLL